MSLAAGVMAKKKGGAPSPGPKSRRGRPKGAGRISTRISVVATAQMLAWLDGFAAHLRKAEISDAVRESFRLAAEATGYEAPPPR